jgi:hypothetical protein
VRDVDFESVWDDPEFQKIRSELADEEPRTPDAPVAFRLTDPKLIPEGIAYNTKSDRFSSAASYKKNRGRESQRRGTRFLQAGRQVGLCAGAVRR